MRQMWYTVIALAVSASAVPGAAQDVLVSTPNGTASAEIPISCPLAGEQPRAARRDVTQAVDGSGLAKPVRLCLDAATGNGLEGGRLSPRAMLERTRQRVATDSQLSEDTRVALLKSIDARLSELHE